MKRLILSVSIIAAIAGCSRASSTPSAVAEEFLHKMNSGDCSGIGDYVAASSRPMAPKLEQLCGANAEIQKAGPNGKAAGSYSVLEATENGERATVRLEAVYGDGSKGGGEPIALVRENGAWKIDLMATAAGLGRALQADYDRGGAAQAPSEAPEPADAER